MMNARRCYARYFGLAEVFCDRGPGDIEGLPRVVGRSKSLRERGKTRDDLRNHSVFQPADTHAPFVPSYGDTIIYRNQKNAERPTLPDAFDKQINIVLQVAGPRHSQVWILPHVPQCFPV